MLTQQELRDMWLAAYESTTRYDDGWYRYENGRWKKVSPNTIKKSVMSVIEEHRPPTAGLVDSVTNLIEWSLAGEEAS